MSELLKISANGQWSLEKAAPLSAEEMAAFKARRDKHLREKHGIAPKEEHEKRLAEQRSKDVPQTTKPSYGHKADAKYREMYHSATKETAPGKFQHQGMPKKPPADVSPPIGKRPEFQARAWDRSPVRMSPKVGKK